MKKVLVVGLGGSGGKTIGFLMDEALAQLKDLGWDSNKLPDCWSFVHIDVPPSVELAVAGEGLAANVVAQGGTYIPLTNPYSTYSNIDSVTFDKFKSSGDALGSGLQDFARWRPDPAHAPKNITAGAGAMRAIGRVLTLSAANDIYASLEKVVRNLINVSPLQGNKLAELLGDGATFEGDQSPLVIMVSSMAGGTGSSMIMDVADILNGLTGNVPGFKGDESVGFLYTADVFKAWPHIYAGAGAGTLAAVSELFHAQTRVGDTWNDHEWHQIVSNAVTPHGQTGRGPAVIFPVGATVAGKSFGNEPNDVYRGFSRVLAPILVSPDTQGGFEAYAISNWKRASNLAEDPFELVTPTNSSAGVVEKYPALFGGFGSATLSTGRDRYKEYAAQRIARQAAQILFEGFESATNDGATTRIAKIQTAASRLYPRIKSVLNFDGFGDFDAANLQKKVLSTYLGSTPGAYTEKFATAFNGAFNNGDGAFVQNVLQNRWKESEQARQMEIQENARTTTLAWAQQLTKDIQEGLMVAVAEFGVAVADEIVNLLTADLQKISETLRSQATPAADNNIKAAVANIGRVKGAIAPANPIVGDFQSKVRTYVMDSLRSNVNKSLSEVITEFQGTVLASIRKEFERVEKNLQNEIGAVPSSVTSAAFREAPLVSWPTGNHIPDHFNPAVNEVLLTPVQSFIEDFDRDVVASVAGVNDPAIALVEIAKRVIARRETVVSGGEAKYGPIHGWKDGETNGHHPHFEFSEEWRPVKLDPVRPANPKIALSLDPADLREYAHDWLDIVGNPFEQACRLSISSWLASNPENEGIFAQQLSEAITFASPLVDLDEQMLSLLHSGKHAGISYGFSSIPISSSSERIVNTVLSKLNTGPSSEQNKQNFTSKCKPSSEAQVVTVSGRTAPYSPWASRSITGPVRSMFAGAGPEANGLGAVWTNMRARTLSQFTPIAQDRIEAFLRGWIIGRMTGRIKITTNPLSKKQDVSVYRDKTQNGIAASWLPFSSTVLGSIGLGIENPMGGKDSTGWNIPAILLESLPLALSRMVPGDLSPWEPYSEVIKLGLSMYTFKGAVIMAGQPAALDRWHSGDDSALGIKSDLTTVRDLDSAKNWTAGIIRDMETISHDPIHQGNFNSINAVREIASLLLGAAKEVSIELSRDNLGIKSSVTATHTEATQATPTSTNGVATPTTES